MDHESADTIWRNWLDNNGWRLLAYARQLVPRQADAEDLLQEVAVELWRRGGGRVPDLPLVYTKLRQRAIDAGRTRTRRDAREERWQSEKQTRVVEFEFPGEAEHRLGRVRAALATLDPNLREVVGLKLWGELTFEQIAGVLGIPRNTAASRYRRAIEKLRPMLANEKQP